MMPFTQNTLMSLIYKGLTLIATLLVGGLLFANFKTTLSIEWPGFGPSVLPLGVFVLVVLVISLIGVAAFLRSQSVRHQHASHQQARQLERMSVSTEQAGETIRALEAKVQTLEKALESALGHSSQQAASSGSSQPSHPSGSPQ